MNLPNFLGIGAPKCGTTWLARCLGEHPEVFMAAVKEVEFWKLADALDRLEEYAEHFAGAGSAKAIGEYSVRYLSLPGVAERIREGLGDVRLIVSLRNPVEQTISNFWHLHRQRFNLAAGERVPQSLEEVLADPQHREFLLNPARYATHLRPYYDLFSKEQIHVILFDQIREAPATALSELYQFLEVDSVFTPPSLQDRGTKVRRGTSPRSARAGRIHELAYGALVNRVYNPLKRIIGVRRAAAIKESLRVRPIMEKLFLRKGYPAPSDRQLAALRAEFQSDIAELEAMTGLGLSAWKQ